MVEMVAGKSLEANAVAEVVARTMSAADKDGDGRISFEDFDTVRAERFFVRVSVVKVHEFYAQ